MSDNKILDALRQLDVDNPNHWTVAGEPRLDTVRLLVGDQSMSRDKIEEAAPDFRRANAKTYGEQSDNKDEQTADNNGTGEQAAPPPPPPATAPAQPPVEQPTVADPAPVPVATANGTQEAEQANVGPTNLNSEGQLSDTNSLPAKPEGEMDMSDKHTSQDSSQPPIASGSPVTPDAPGQQEEQPWKPPVFGGVNDDIADAQASTNNTIAAREASTPQGLTNESGTDESAEQRPGEAQLSAVDHGSDGDPNAVETLEAKLAKAEAHTAGLKEMHAEITAELDKAAAAESTLRVAIEKARPHGGTMPAIQAYFARQNEVAEQVVEARKQITDSGINFGELKKVMEGAPIGQVK